MFAPSYNFGHQGTTHLFVEGLVGYTGQLNGTSRGGLSWGGRLGFKIEAVDGGLIILAVKYLQVDLSPTGATSRSGYNDFSLSAGVTLWR